MVDVTVFFTVTRIRFLSTTLPLQEQHIIVKATTLLVVICICTPFSNALWPWLLSQMNLIKTNLRKRLTNNSLYLTLRICIGRIPLESFHSENL